MWHGRRHRGPHAPPHGFGAAGSPSPPTSSADFHPFDTPSDRAAEFRPFDDPADDAEIDIPVIWLVLLAILACCCVCCVQRWRRRAGEHRSVVAADDDASSEEEVEADVGRVARVVGYEVQPDGRVAYDCLDDDGEELTIERNALLQNSVATERLVRDYESRYPLPWTSSQKPVGKPKAPRLSPYDSVPSRSRQRYS